MPGNVIRFIVSGDSSVEPDETELDSDQVGIQGVFDSLRQAASAGGIFVVKDNKTLLAINLQNVQTVTVELDEDE
jgi:hypothetical protein